MSLGLRFSFTVVPLTFDRLSAGDRSESHCNQRHSVQLFVDWEDVHDLEVKSDEVSRGLQSASLDS